MTPRSIRLLFDCIAVVLTCASLMVPGAPTEILLLLAIATALTRMLL